MFFVCIFFDQFYPNNPRKKKVSKKFDLLTRKDPSLVYKLRGCKWKWHRAQLLPTCFALIISSLSFLRASQNFLYPPLFHLSFDSIEKEKVLSYGYFLSFIDSLKLTKPVHKS
jgi:hypothetical protein